MDQVLKKAGRIPEQILGKVSIAVSVFIALQGCRWVDVCLSTVMPDPGSSHSRIGGCGREILLGFKACCFLLRRQSLYVLLFGSSGHWNK